LRRKHVRQETAAPEALVDVLVPLSRLMIRSELGAGDLVRAAKLSFIRAAASEVMPKGSRVNVSRLSVVTGLTRKEVAALLGKQGKPRKVPLRKQAMEQRALRVLRGWRVDPLFQSGSGRPAVLSLGGNRSTFRRLVKTYAGDVTPVSVLDELLRMELVTITRDGRLQLRASRVRASTHASLQLAELAKIFSDFAQTASRSPTSQETPVFFGFRESSVSTPEQASLFQRTFSRRAAMLLESIEQWVNHQRAGTPQAIRRRGSKRRIGMGIYFVNDSSSKA
jgi:hypothetical protein